MNKETEIKASEVKSNNVHQDDPCLSAHGPDCNRC